VLTTAAYAFVVIGRVSDVLPSLHLAFVLGALVAGVALFGSRAGGARVLRSPESRALLALLALSTVTIPFSVWPGMSLAFVTDSLVKLAFLFGMTVYLARSARDVRILVWAVLAAMLFLSIGLIGWGEGTRLHITSTYDANDIAFVMVTGFPLAAIWCLKGRGPSRALAGLTAALAVVTIVLTQSRAGFLGFCAVLCLLLLGLRGRQRLAAGAIVAACVLIVGAFGSQSYWDRMATIWGGGDEARAAIDDYDASGLAGARWTLWQSGMWLMLEHPLFGVGAGAYDVAEGLSHGGTGKWSTAHNAFLQIGAELGITGLALFIYLLYRGVKNCRRVVRLAERDPALVREAWLARSIEISLYGYIIVGLTLSQAYSYLPYYLLALSVVLARPGAAGVRESGRLDARLPAAEGTMGRVNGASR
jgi:O-antigen ligase